MFAEAGGPHNAAHFHEYYQDDTTVFGLDPIDLLAGELPQRQRRLVEAWAELHHTERVDDWAALQAGRRPLPLAPLA